MSNAIPGRTWFSGLLVVALVASSSSGAVATSTRGPLETRLTPVTAEGPATLPVALDSDADGWTDDVESNLESDPADATITPESVAIPKSCFDALDNDLDGATDDSDSGCQPPALFRETFPPAGVDGFESTMSLDAYDLATPLGICPVDLEARGPTVVQRGDPVDVGGGLRQFRTEIVAMQLTGTGTLLSGSPCNPDLTTLSFPVTIVEDPAQPSIGKVSDTNPSATGDFPADSFFDVFFLVDTPRGLFPGGPPGGPAGAPLQVTNVVRSIPPYHSPGNATLNPDCYTVAGLPHKHCPKPPLDHFKCYTGAFPSVSSRRATLEDQFERKRTRVAQPDRFCNPVSKNGLEIFDQGAHLKRYVIEDVKRQTPFAPLGVLVQNQFGLQELTVLRSVGLLVPSEKDELPPPAALDHFKCYSAQGLKVGSTVTLVDQFDEQDGRVEQALVGEPRTLCNPVAKTVKGVTTPIGDADLHLVCYSITTQKFEPRSVFVRNQFGQEVVTVKEPVELCVPSTKLRVSTHIKIPTLHLFPTRIRTGQTVYITGQDFTPGGGITKTIISPNGSEVSFNTKADANGVVTGNLTIPKNGPTGTWQVIAQDDATGRVATATFKVRRPSRGTVTGR